MARLPLDLARRADEQVERIHARLRERAGGKLVLPIDPVVVAEDLLGLDVIVLDDGPAGDVIRNDDGSPKSGVLLFREGRIFVDGRDARQRQRFTIAHEIAHEVLGHERLLGAMHVVAGPGGRGGDGDAADGSDDVWGSDDARAIAERQAQHFAGRLLVPRALLDEMVAEHGASVAALARLFDVSVPAMRVQLASYLPTVYDRGR